MTMAASRGIRSGGITRVLALAVPTLVVAAAIASGEPSEIV